MRLTLGTTSGPQRQVLYSALKDVNSSVGLCFFVSTYRNDLISVGGHNKKHKKIYIWNISVVFAPIACFPQK